MTIGKTDWLGISVGAVVCLGCIVVFTWVTYSINSGRVAVCSYGHKTLKDVRIIYHALNQTIPIDDKLQNEITNNRVVILVYPQSLQKPPDKTVFCTTCGMKLIGGWTRESEDQASFFQPFSALIQDFPISVPSRRKHINYTQDVFDGFVVSERLELTTTEPLPKLKEQVEVWAKSHDIQLTPETLATVAPYRLYPKGKLLTEQSQFWGYKTKARVTGHVHFVAYSDDGVVKIDLLVTLSRHSEKETIDEALRKDRQTPPPRR